MEFTAFEYLDALDEKVYSDKKMKKDSNFIRMIEDMGYKVIG